MQQAQNQLPRTWFILGHEPLLSVAEIFSFLGEPKPFSFSPSVLKVEGVYEPEMMIELLGGTIKIGKEVASNLSEENLLSRILNELLGLEGKINFGISLYSANDPQLVEKWGKFIKKSLKSEGRSARYVYKKESILSSVTVQKNSLIEKGAEFLVKQNKSGVFSLAKTAAVQPFESFSARDYGRPGRDDVSGMLPPKLAIMMINLLQQPKDEHILDPFCGSGTILSEAVLLGYKSITGTDISYKAVKDTLKNIEWTKTQYPHKFEGVKAYIKTADVRKISEILGKDSIQGIVTEPFLGIPRRGKEDQKFLEDQAKELSGLFSSAFAEFKKILRPGGRVVFVIPRFYSGGQWISVSDHLVPRLKNIGFAPERLLPESISKEPFVLYRRPEQLVGREIWRFRTN